MSRQSFGANRANAPTLVLHPMSPQLDQAGNPSLDALAADSSDGIKVVHSASADTFNGQWVALSPDKNANLTVDSLSPSIVSPRAGSVWAAQALSSQAAANSGWWSLSGSWLSGGSGLRTPSGFEHLDFGADYFSILGADKRVPRSFEWELWAADQTRPPTPALSPSPPSSPPSIRSASPVSAVSDRFEDVPNASEVVKRRLGPNEVSYYLGSRGAGPDDLTAGVNDMYLHVAFKASPALVTPARVAKIWAELRLRHTLLSSSVEYEGFEDVRFVFQPIFDIEDAVAAAADNLEFKYGVTKDEVLDAYLNGPRTLSDQKLAGLWITTEKAEVDLSGLSLSNQDKEEQSAEYHFWLLATHFLGDGMALHTTANEFFQLLGGGLEAAEAENKGLEWDVTTGQVRVPPLSRLPPAQETRISTPEHYGRLAWAAARVEFRRNQGQMIGGHTFPRAKLGARHTVVPTLAFSKEDTSKILKACKANGVTIAHAVFALANMAKIKVSQESAVDEPWGSQTQKDSRMPMMLYSALNLRPNMAKGPEEESLGIKPDFFHLVIGYYNVMLPTFSISSLSPAQTFWHRARLTKEQTVQAVKSKWLTQRSKLMSLERERRAIGFEKEDERRRRQKAAKEAGMPTIGLGRPADAPAPAEQPKAAPSLAFLGVSMLGNLDGMYKHATFPRVQLQALTTGSRQRPGAMLLFAYTFCGQLFFSLGYDANAYPQGSVEQYWQAMLDYTKAFMVDA